MSVCLSNSAEQAYCDGLAVIGFDYAYAYGNCLWPNWWNEIKVGPHAVWNQEAWHWAYGETDPFDSNDPISYNCNWADIDNVLGTLCNEPAYDDNGYVYTTENPNSDITLFHMHDTRFQGSLDFPDANGVPNCLGNLPNLKQIYIYGTYFNAGGNNWQTESGLPAGQGDGNGQLNRGGGFYCDFNTHQNECESNGWSYDGLHYHGPNYVSSTAPDGDHWSEDIGFTAGCCDSFNFPDLSNTPLEKLTIMEGSNQGLNSLGLTPNFIDKLPTTLKYLEIKSSSWYGWIPYNINRLVNLEVINLSGNNLSGPIPEELWELPNLRWLDLSNNTLGGTVEILDSYPYVTGIDGPYTTPTAGTHNEIYSTLSGNIGNASALANLDIEDNHFDLIEEEFCNNPYIDGTNAYTTTGGTTYNALGGAYWIDAHTGHPYSDEDDDYHWSEIHRYNLNDNYFCYVDLPSCFQQNYLFGYEDWDGESFEGDIDNDQESLDCSLGEAPPDPVPGCMDDGYCTVDICGYDSPNPTVAACNYHEDVNTDNGTCFYIGEWNETNFYQACGTTYQVYDGNADCCQCGEENTTSTYDSETTSGQPLFKNNLSDYEWFSATGLIPYEETIVEGGFEYKYKWGHDPGNVFKWLDSEQPGLCEYLGFNTGCFNQIEWGTSCQCGETPVKCWDGRGPTVCKEEHCPEEVMQIFDNYTPPNLGNRIEEEYLVSIVEGESDVIEIPIACEFDEKASEYYIAISFPEIFRNPTVPHLESDIAYLDNSGNTVKESIKNWTQNEDSNVVPTIYRDEYGEIGDVDAIGYDDFSSNGGYAIADSEGSIPEEILVRVGPDASTINNSFGSVTIGIDTFTDYYLKLSFKTGADYGTYTDFSYTCFQRFDDYVNMNSTEFWNQIGKDISNATGGSGTGNPFTWPSYMRAGVKDLPLSYIGSINYFTQTPLIRTGYSEFESDEFGVPQIDEMEQSLLYEFDPYRGIDLRQQNVDENICSHIELMRIPEFTDLHGNCPSGDPCPMTDGLFYPVDEWTEDGDHQWFINATCSTEWGTDGGYTSVWNFSQLRAVCADGSVVMMGISNEGNPHINFPGSEVIYTNGIDACKSQNILNTKLFYLSDGDKRPSLGVFSYEEDNVLSDNFLPTIPSEINNFIAYPKQNLITNGDGVGIAEYYELDIGETPIVDFKTGRNPETLETVYSHHSCEDADDNTLYGSLASCNTACTGSCTAEFVDEWQYHSDNKMGPYGLYLPDGWVDVINGWNDMRKLYHINLRGAYDITHSNYTELESDYPGVDGAFKPTGGWGYLNNIGYSDWAVDNIQLFTGWDRENNYGLLGGWSNKLNNVSVPGQHNIFHISLWAKYLEYASYDREYEFCGLVDEKGNGQYFTCGDDPLCTYNPGTTGKNSWHSTECCLRMHLEYGDTPPDDWETSIIEGFVPWIEPPQYEYETDVGLTYTIDADSGNIIWDETGYAYQTSQFWPYALPQDNSSAWDGSFPYHSILSPSFGDMKRRDFVCNPWPTDMENNLQYNLLFYEDHKNSYMPDLLDNFDSDPADHGSIEVEYVSDISDDQYGFAGWWNYDTPTRANLKNNGQMEHHWAQWIRSEECYSHNRCLFMGTHWTTYPQSWYDSDRQKLYNRLNQYQKIYDWRNPTTEIMPYSSLKVSFMMKTKYWDDGDGPPEIEAIITYGDNPGNGIDANGDTASPETVFDSSSTILNNMSPIVGSGVFNSNKDMGGWGSTGELPFSGAERFSNTELNKWEKMEFIFNLSEHHINQIYGEKTKVQDLYFAIQWGNNKPGSVYIDNMSVTEAYNFIPDADVRAKLGRNNYSQASLLNYYDKNIEPIMYEETSAPLEANFYFYPRYYHNIPFGKEKDIMHNDFRRGLFYLYDVDWGDGSANEFISDPLKLGNNVSATHTYEKSGIYEVTGYMIRLRPDDFMEYDISKGSIYNQKFSLKINVNDGTDEDFTYFGSDGFSFIPYKNTLPVIGGINKESSYYKGVSRQSGFIGENIKISPVFSKDSDQLKTELALIKMDNNRMDELEVVPQFQVPRYSDKNVQDEYFMNGYVDDEASKIYDGITPIEEELGTSVGDSDLTNIRYFDKPKYMWEMLGFSCDEASDINIYNLIENGGFEYGQGTLDELDYWKTSVNCGITYPTPNPTFENGIMTLSNANSANYTTIKRLTENPLPTVKGEDYTLTVRYKLENDEYDGTWGGSTRARINFYKNCTQYGNDQSSCLADCGTYVAGGNHEYGWDSTTGECLSTLYSGATDDLIENHPTIILQDTDGEFVEESYSFTANYNNELVRISMGYGTCFDSNTLEIGTGTGLDCVTAAGDFIDSDAICESYAGWADSKCVQDNDGNNVCTKNCSASGGCDDSGYAHDYDNPQVLHLDWILLQEGSDTFQEIQGRSNYVSYDEPLLEGDCLRINGAKPDEWSYWKNIIPKDHPVTYRQGIKAPIETLWKESYEDDALIINSNNGQQHQFDILPSLDCRFFPKDVYGYIEGFLEFTVDISNLGFHPTLLQIREGQDNPPGQSGPQMAFEPPEGEDENVFYSTIYLVDYQGEGDEIYPPFVVQKNEINDGEGWKIGENKIKVNIAELLYADASGTATTNSNNELIGYRNGYWDDYEFTTIRFAIGGSESSVDGHTIKIKDFRIYNDVIEIDTESTQYWPDDNHDGQHDYYYPVLPKYDKFGKLEGEYPPDIIPFPETGPITEENYQGASLKINILTEELENNILFDKSGHMNHGFTFNDYTVKYDEETNEPETTRTTLRFRKSTKNGAF